MQIEFIAETEITDLPQAPTLRQRIMQLDTSRCEWSRDTLKTAPMVQDARLTDLLARAIERRIEA